ncbi:hypothetical protein GGQ74_001146 [Desulfobaculum xiamenense]|uniref:Uncharacterized protein n=1 Tax=Desulfobaculum xiamenense TaxID=995050 RepID=A0A846QFE2_9BACT|nr:cytoplasmic protein [Desulfobaculum xiamenense]NJB67506.1 hypothetical protein [Desulfobaculum xiamenense]
MIILDDTPPFSDVCSLCAHITDHSKRRCRAFPNGIPDAIWLGDDAHRAPWPDQGNDIVFERSVNR